MLRINNLIKHIFYDDKVTYNVQDVLINLDLKNNFSNNIIYPTVNSLILKTRSSRQDLFTNIINKIIINLAQYAHKHANHSDCVCCSNSDLRRIYSPDKIYLNINKASLELQYSANYKNI